MFSDHAIIIQAQDRVSRDLQLDEAVRLLKDKATDRGIRIIRHEFGSFTVSLSSAVEYGLIQELDLL